MGQACAFYKAVLGMEPTYESDFWTSFDLGCVNLALHGGRETEPVGGWIPSMNVEDLVAFRSAVLAAGGKVGEFHDTPRGAVLDLFDLDCNKLQAMQFGSKAADLAKQV